MQKNLETMTMEELQEYRKHCLNNVSKFKNFQLVKKVQLNSAYGALG